MALDTYLEGDLLRELLVSRTKELTISIKALETERAKLQTQLGADVLTDSQIRNLEAFATAIQERLPAADADFQKRRAVIDMLDLRGKLLLLDREKAISLAGHLGECSPLVVSPTMNNQARRTASARRR